MRELLRWLACDADHGWALEQTGAASATLTGPISTVAPPFVEAIVSWAAATPGESWIEVEMRVRREGHWSQFYQIARWDDRLEASKRTSFAAQRDDDGRVAVDTLVASGPCDAVQPRFLLYGTPTIQACTIALSAAEQAAAPGNLPAIAELMVPLRSQLAYPNGGTVWCSPTSVTMLLAYWHAQTGAAQLAPYAAFAAVPELAAKYCHDPAYEGTGNWIFNTAFAASLGLDAYVARFSSLAELAPWLAAGVPIIISVAWQAGELDGALLKQSSGHLLIVTGFDGVGGVFVADPASADLAQVRRCYDASQLQRAWLGNSDGTVYVITTADERR